MTANKIQDFFHKKNRESEGTVNWEAKKSRWIAAIEKLYERITKEYLASAIAAKDVSVSYSKKTIVEQFIGQYDVPELVLEVRNERVVFSPKGCNIVGAAGRIDLKGERGEQTLVVQPDDRWGIVASRAPLLKVVPLDEDAFLDALRSVMRP